MSGLRVEHRRGVPRSGERDKNRMLLVRIDDKILRNRKRGVAYMRKLRKNGKSPAKLSRCPFCGGHADVDDGAVLYRVVCDKCGASTKYCKRRSDAIELWEERVESKRDELRRPLSDPPNVLRCRFSNSYN